MKTHTIKSQIMRTLLFILLFVSGLVYAQPPINNPTPLQVCDSDNDGAGSFDLTSKNIEILGALNPLDYTVSYHGSLFEAQGNLYPIYTITNFVTGNAQTLYVRVTDNTTSEYATTTLNLILNSSPTIIQPSNFIQITDLTNIEFDLTTKNAEILGTLNPLDYSISYYTSNIDALNEINPIVTSYTNISNPEAIYVRVENNSTSCFSIKNFYLIVNLFTISNPSPLQTCDLSNNLGYGTFFIGEIGGILGSLSSSLYTVTYYETLANSQSGTNPLPTTNYANTTPFTQTIFVRVTENANPLNYATTTLDLIVIPSPILYQVTNLTQIDNDGFASFDLTTNNSPLIGGANPSDYIFSYYQTINGSFNTDNPIPDFFNYTNITNPENITVKVTNTATGCYQFSGFNIIVQASDFQINTPTTLSVCGNSFGIGEFNLHLKDIEILGSLNPSNYTVTYYANSNDAFNEQNALPFVYTNTTSSSQTIFVRVDENATTNFSTTTLQLYAITPPFIATTVPNLTITENPFDGIANFDLTQQNNIILTNTNDTVNYYINQTDAENQTNAIPNSNSFTGSNLQVIWFNVTTPTTSCFSVGSFLLNVVDSSSVINIPDANFKARLLQSDMNNNLIVYGMNSYIKIDANDDNEIQFSEAAVVTGLFVGNSNISDMTGIESFPNLHTLECDNNFITNINLTNNISLEGLGCSNNIISNLNLTNNTSLQTLNCSSNILETLNTSTLTSLIGLRCDSNQLTSLDLNNNTNLNTLRCSNNFLTSLNLNTTTNLSILNLSNNNFTSLNISNLNNLSTLELTNNQLNTLSLNNLNSLHTLEVSNNQLTSLDVSSLTNLYYMMCINNSLTNINFGTTSNLLNFNCSNNQLSSINLSNLTSLFGLDCNNNLFTTLDLKHNNNLNYVSIINCANLETLFIKNGSTENTLNFSNNPNLSFICADEDQISDIQNQLIANGMTNTVVNSYCSFTPGGNYNTITGNITFDANNNGCDANDLSKQNIRIDINEGTNSGATFTNNIGNYNFYTQAGSYLLTPSIENLTWFTFSPTSATALFTDSNNNISTKNFCLAANGTHNDLEVSIIPVTPARPGFDATYKIVYKNKGNQTLSGDVNLNFDDLKTDFVSANPLVDNLAVNSLTWNFSNLLPFENRSIDVVLNVNSPTETPAVNIGNQLLFNATITPVVGDELPVDNLFSYTQTVVGSFDPNDITCLEGETVSPSEIGKYLHYAVNFENTGTYEAENVVVKDVIDISKYDIESLQVMNTSHSAYIKITGNVVEFIFQNINLAPRGGNPPVGGHGNVLFKIKSKNNLVVDDFVEKTAKIYFDYNAPIDTNIAQTTFVSLSNSIPVFDNSVIVFPNPTTGNVNISSNFKIKSIELYDIQGRILETSFENNTTVKFNISEKQNGIYFLKVNTENGSKIEKVVKE